MQVHNYQSQIHLIRFAMRWGKRHRQKSKLLAEVATSLAGACRSHIDLQTMQMLALSAQRVSSCMAVWCKGKSVVE